MKNLLVLFIAVIVLSSCGRERGYFQDIQGQVHVLPLLEYTDFVQVGDTVVIVNKLYNSSDIRSRYELHSLNTPNIPSNTIDTLSNGIVEGKLYKKAWRLK